MDSTENVPSLTDGGLGEPPRRLTNAELAADHPAVLALVLKLDRVKATAPHLADPRDGVRDIAAALADYFRTPDELA